MAVRITVTKALEARLRKGEGLADVVKLVDEAHRKRAIGSELAEAKTGLSYKELVALFRFYLGSELITPPRPSTPYIVKIVNRAKEQGIDQTNVEQILMGLRRVRRAPYRLADIVFNCDQYYAAGDIEEKDAGAAPQVYTGRELL